MTLGLCWHLPLLLLLLLAWEVRPRKVVCSQRVGLSDCQWHTGSHNLALMPAFAAVLLGLLYPQHRLAAWAWCCCC